MAHATFARFGRQPLGVRRLSGDAARQGSGVRSFGRSGFASEVRPCLSCCTERAHEMTSNPRIWKQHRLLVPPAAPMDHAPWCGGRVAPSPGTRAAIWVACHVSRGGSGPKRTLPIFTQNETGNSETTCPLPCLYMRISRYWGVLVLSGCLFNSELGTRNSELGRAVNCL